MTGLKWQSSAASINQSQRRKNSPACYHAGEFFLFLHYSVYRRLSLYTSGSVAASQGLNFFSGYQVEVTGDGVLQSGCSYAVLKSILEVLAIQHTADHAACEGVAAAYTVNDGMDAVLFGVIELLGISGVDASRPAVIGSGMAYTQRGYAVLEVELFNHLLEDGLVTG